MGMRATTRRLRFSLALAASVALVAACSDDDDGGGGSGGSSAQPEGGMTRMDSGATPQSDGGTPSESDGATTPMADTGPAPMPVTCDPGGECDPFDDAGTCGEEACLLGSSGLSCGALNDGAGAEGDDCSAPGDCGKGLACITVDGATRCVRLCPLDSVGHCGNEAACSGTTTAACVGFCRPLAMPCNIFAQDCEDAADSCTLALNEETDEHYTGCMPAGSGGEGASCANVAGCQKGLICVGGSCVKVCQSGGDGGTLACTGGRRCTGRSTAWDIPYCR